MGEMSEYYRDQELMFPRTTPAHPRRRARQQENILLLDVATSGFDPEKDVVLEIALALVSAGPSLEILETGHHIVHCEGEWDGDTALHVPEFHRTNGLALDCWHAGSPLRKIEAALLAGPWSSAARLVNRNAAFDRKFVAKHLPTFAAGLPKQTLDINELEYAATVLSGLDPVERPSRTYRAEDDLCEAYEALRYYLQALWNVNAGP